MTTILTPREFATAARDMSRPRSQCACGATRHGMCCGDNRVDIIVDYRTRSGPWGASVTPVAVTIQSSPLAPEET